MKNLPVEIAIRIFCLLHQRDKLQCMLVCHEWESIIKPSVLFDTLRISSQKGLKSAISCVQKNPSYETQVKRLLFQVNPGNDFDVSVLPKFFPNVLYCYINPFIRISPRLHPFRAWHNKLRQFFEHEIGDIRILIKSSIWPNITTLELDITEREPDAKSYLELFRHTPGLKDLTLSNIEGDGYRLEFSMDDFESLHSILSSLKSLSLKGIIYDGSDPPADIVPASSVTCLFLGCFTTDLLFKKRYFSYISRKYQNVSDLTIHVTGRYDIPDYKTNRSYEEWDNVLMNLSSRLKKLDLRWSNEYESSYVLKTLDERHCRLESLSVPLRFSGMTIELLPELNFVRYLRSIKVKGPWCRRYEWLEPMTMLTELNIDMDDSSLDIDVTDIIIACGPHLQSIICGDGSFSFKMVRVDGVFPVFNQFKKLEFNNTRVPSNFGTFIERSFPQLHTLRFNNCFDREKFAGDEIHLILPSMDLGSLQVLDDFGSDRYIFVLTLCDNKKRLYTTDGDKEATFSLFEECFGLHDMAVYPPPISMDYSAKSVIPFMTLVCNSLKDICIVDIKYN